MKKNKLPKYESEAQAEIKRFLIILGGVVLLTAIIFLYTKYIINDGDVRIPTRISQEGEINHEVVTVGTMFNRVDSEYYVLVYDDKDVSSSYYLNLANIYNSKAEKLAFYYCNINNALNKDFRADKNKPENILAETINEVSFGNIALVKIKDGKIINYYNEKESIKNVLDVKES